MRRLLIGLLLFLFIGWVVQKSGHGPAVKSFFSQVTASGTTPIYLETSPLPEFTPLVDQGLPPAPNVGAVLLSPERMVCNSLALVGLAGYGCDSTTSSNTISPAPLLTPAGNNSIKIPSQQTSSHSRNLLVKVENSPQIYYLTEDGNIRELYNQ